MSRADFEDFLKRKHKDEAEHIKFDAEEQLREWLDYLDQLYKKVEEFMASYIQNETAKITFKTVVLNEDFSGPYEARQMLVQVASSTIIFDPIGTMLIGSKGRVDVIGPRGTARLSLVGRKVTDARQLVQVRVSIDGTLPPPIEPSPGKIDWAWKIITPAPDFKFLDVTEDNFFDMILGVADV